MTYKLNSERSVELINEQQTLLDTYTVELIHEDVNTSGVFEKINYLVKEYPTTPDIYTIKKSVGVKVSSPEAAAKLFKIAMQGLDKEREHFLSASLDTKNQLKGLDIISIGSLNANIVHPREVFYAAIANRAAAIIIAHNHPSGDPAPSHNDIAITEKLKKGGEILGIEVYDHIIFGTGPQDGFLSMKEQSLGGWV